MRDPIPATLIYNPTAGSSGGLRPPDLFKLFRQIQVQLNHRKTERPEDIAGVLPETSEPIVVMGGDGTVRAVIQALRGRPNPLVILPAGSANNIARSFGLMKLTIPEIIPLLQDPVRRAIDLGRIRFPWGEGVVFVEGVGFGLFADMMATYDPTQGKSFSRGLQTLVDELGKKADYRTRIRVDDEEFEARFRLVEVLNTPAVGPRLAFLPEARMTDGKLAVVIADETINAGVAIPALAAHKFAQLEAVRTLFGEKIEVEWTDFAVHVDDIIYPSEEVRAEMSAAPPKDRSIHIHVLHEAISLWLPNLSEDND
jgi:diacylglycerol kinase family enzyme